MEIIGTSNIEGDPYETAMVGEDHDDDLLGEDLIDMEDTVINDAEEMVDTVSREKADTAKTEKSKASSYKSGKISGIPLSLQSKKAEFLRRGSPKLRRSSSRDTAHSGRQRTGPIRDMKGSTRKSKGLEGSKNTSRRHP